ncbi:MAG: hypothetical protein KGI69_00840 [Patescibacteria group bacterium]|nr:hypothetical protein [Patescibacteria group bacterium]
MRTDLRTAPLRPNRSDGYTLLFAVLTAALVLGVAVFILDVSRKQYELSVSARDSMYSFYAADSGIECVAEYGGTNSPNGDIYSSSTPPASVACGLSTVTSFPWTHVSDSSHAKYANDTYNNGYDETTFNIGFSGGTCAAVTIDEYYDSSLNYYDNILSSGYNKCVANGGAVADQPDTSDPTIVERALQLSHTTAP